MKRAFLLLFIFNLIAFSCKTEEAYSPSMGIFVGRIICNNDSLNVFQYGANHPEVANFTEADTLTVGGVKYENVFLMYDKDPYTKDAFQELQKGKYYSVTGKKDLVRTDFPCINRRGLRLYQDVLKVWFTGI